MKIEKKKLYFMTDEKNDGRIIGAYSYYGTHMTVTINSTNEGDYSLVGRIVIKNDRGGNLKNKEGKDYKKKFLIKEKNPSMELLQKIIEEKMDEFYVQLAPLIKRIDNSSVNPNSINPITAVARFGGTYVEKCKFKANNRDRAAEKRYKQLMKIAKSLPQKSMESFSAKEINKILNKFNRSEIMHFYDFWQYCIDEKICTGDNKIVIPPRTKHDKRKILRRKLKEYSYLTSLDQELFYKEMPENFNGYKVGMVIEVGCCMYDADEVFSYNWSDISFAVPTGIELDDFAVLKREYKRKNTAIHNGSVVIAPESAKLLKRRYNELVMMYGNKEIVDNMPLVSKVEDPLKKLSKEAYKKSTHLFLRKLLNKSKDYQKREKMLDPNERMDIAQTHSILKNTYKWNICNRVKFTKNPEMREYLFGEIPYNDTTSFNYVCFSTGEAQLRYYKAFSILKNETAIDKVKTQNEYCCKNMAIPDTNIDYCKLMAEIILQPGGEIELSSPGGVTSDVETSYSNS